MWRRLPSKILRKREVGRRWYFKTYIRWSYTSLQHTFFVFLIALAEDVFTWEHSSLTERERLYELSLRPSRSCLSSRYRQCSSKVSIEKVFALKTNKISFKKNLLLQSAHHIWILFLLLHVGVDTLAILVEVLLSAIKARYGCALAIGINIK